MQYKPAGVCYDETDLHRTAYIRNGIFNMPKQTSKPTNLSNDIIAYIVSKNNNRMSRFDFHNKSGNTTNAKKSLEFRILFGDVEKLLLTMDTNRGEVQNALMKLDDLKKRVLYFLEDAEEAPGKGKQK